MGNWDSGQVQSLSAGQTLTCETLNQGQIYAIFLRNSNGADNNAYVTVDIGNSVPPQTVQVNGTTGGQGLASLVLVSGNDTSTVGISIASGAGQQQVQCWIGSVSMPTNTAGLTNAPLPANGQRQAFGTPDRYYVVPPSEWSTLEINSNITQFISVQFQESLATVYICNPGPLGVGALTSLVTCVGPSSTAAYKPVAAPPSSPQTISESIFGDGTQWVFMNADSGQDSTDATISLQLLAAAAAV
jgi:hypothetical protein